MVNLHPETVKFLETFGTTLLKGGNKYYYMPYWIEKVEDKGSRLQAQYIFHSLENIPEELKEALDRIRND